MVLANPTHTASTFHNHDPCAHAEHEISPSIGHVVGAGDQEAPQHHLTQT